MTSPTEQPLVTATLWLERAEHCNPILPTAGSPMFSAVAEEMEEYAECKVAAFARVASAAIASAEQSAATPWFAWPARKTWEEVRVRLRSRDGNEWEEIASDFEYWMQSADGEMCDDVVAFQIIGETPLGLASVSSASAEPRKDTVAFVQDWLMNTDYDPTQFDKGFAAAIDARHGFDDAALTAIAERFCAAPLPDTLCADLVAIKPMAGRSGTNLMTVAEAKAVLRSIFPEPVPATNQAGEVERLRAALQAVRRETDNPGTRSLKRIGVLVRAALATQPATSQEGEAYSRGAEAMREAVVAWLGTHSTAFKGYWHCDPQDALDAMATLPYIALAATPTPPTLSEDLRECLRNLEAACDDLAANRSQETYRNMVDCDRATPYLSALDDARHAARAALARVKAS